jgi:aminopeptidase N
MKIILCVFLFALGKPLFSQNLNVLQYTYNIELNDSTDVIRCSALVKLKSDNKRIALDLVDNMKTSTVWDTRDNKRLKYKHSGNVLTIERVSADTAETIIGINYSGTPKDGLIISRNKFGQRTFFTDHWPNRAHQWLVCHDHPSDKAAVDFIVKAPSRYQVISNGIQIEETNIDSRNKLTYWRETVELPTKVMCVGVSEFAVGYAGSVNDIPVYSWVFPGNRVKGFADYQIATEVLQFFIKNIAPYPYQKLANVQSKTMFGGMENASAIFYFENSVTGTGKTTELIAHEIAHQWFGNMVTEADWPHVWLSEGFATYLEILYMESKYGIDTAKEELRFNRQKVIEFHKKVKSPVVDTTTKDYMTLLNANSYEKGGWVLHMLRRQLGDSVFWKGLRKYYTMYAGKNAVTEDFRKVMEDVSGKDLKNFFQQWLYNAGHPVLKVNRQYDDDKNVLHLTVVQQQPDVFEVPLKIQVNCNGSSIVKQVIIKDKQTSVEIPMRSKPSSVVLDPDCDLLFE